MSLLDIQVREYLTLQDACFVYMHSENITPAISIIPSANIIIVNKHTCQYLRKCSERLIKYIFIFT